MSVVPGARIGSTKAGEQDYQIGYLASTTAWLSTYCTFQWLRDFDALVLGRRRSLSSDDNSECAVLGAKRAQIPDDS